MKRLLTLICTIVLTLPAFAQHSSNSHFLRFNNLNLPLTVAKKFPSYNHFEKKDPLSVMQKLDSDSNQEYDVISSKWVNNSLNEYTYNSSGMNTSVLYSEWNPDTELYDQIYRQELSYNNGLLSEQIYYEWDAPTSHWDPAQKETYTYNGAGNMTLAYTYYFDDPGWTLAGKDERTYNGSGNLILEIMSFWDESGNDWMNSIKIENTYNGSGYLTLTTMSLWDFFTQIWKNDSKDDYTYNGAGQLITDISFQWNDGSNQWLNDTKEEYTYDGNLNLVLALDQDWMGGQWANSSKTEITYNNDYTYNQLILPGIYVQNGFEQIFMHMPVELVQSDYVGSSYVLADKTHYNFSEINITDVPNVESNHTRIYPQPADYNVTFEWESSNPTFELDLYNINGKLVLEEKIGKNKEVNINQLASGIYFYRLTDNKQPSISGKMSVR